MTRESGCPGGPEAHDAHLAVNGECPWCSAYEPDARLGTIDDDGTIRDADGDVVEHGIDLQAVDEALAAIIPIRREHEATVTDLTEYSARRAAATDDLEAAIRRHPSNVFNRKDPK